VCRSPPSYIRGVKHDRSYLVDAAVVVWVLVVIAVGGAMRADASTRPLALTLGIAAAAVLVLRRRAPTATFAVSAGLVLALFAVDPTVGAVAAIAPAVALYTLALSRGRLHLVVGAAAAAAAVVVADLFLSGHHGPTLTLQTAAHVSLVAIPVLAAEALRNRRAYVQALLERLELAEREQEEEIERRAQQERLRIARDLHDVVAHTLTTINVQAGVAAHLLDREPSPAREALATIEADSHEALEELRTILGVLREQGNGQAAPLEPAPGLTALDALIEQARGTGLEVSFDVEGEQPAQVPDTVQLAAFRIVQESLTNARRHAPGAATQVTLAYRPDRLCLAIENEMRHTGNGNSGPGVGILGMHERSTALGGSFEAEPSGDRFRVVAELPYRRSS
jgi:signal transduction histidine kinase